MEDITIGTGPGTGETETVRTHTYRLMGTAQDLVLVDAAMLEGGGSMGITLEADVCKGGSDNNTNPQPPTKTYRDCEVLVITVGTEVGRRKERFIGGMKKAGHVG